IGGLMACMVMFFSCTKDKTVANLAEKAQKSNLQTMNTTAGFTDEDIFRGVMFLDGPAASLLEDFSEYNFREFVQDPEKINEVVTFHNEIINYLTTANSNYLSDFR